MEKNKSKGITAGRVFAVIWRGVLVLLITALATTAVSLAYDKFVNKSRIPSVFGYSLLVIATPSMADAIDAGDAIIIKKAEVYAVGDVITYFPADEDYSVTHRIVRIDGDKFYTKGDANPSEDPDPVFAAQIVGKVEKQIPKAGFLIEWLKSPSGIAFAAAFAVIIIALIVIDEKWQSPEKTEEKKISGGAEV